MSKTPAQRQKDYRDAKRNAQRAENVTRVTVEPERNAPPVDRNVLEGKPSIGHYHARPDLYIQRREPDRLNWGPWMNSDALNEAGLKANRVPIPGDWDYTGAASALMADIEKVNVITEAAQDEYTSMVGKPAEEVV